MAVLEVIAFDLEGCKIAEDNGADRIELCADPHLGGTTPSFELIDQCVNSIQIPINVMIRPRGGDFVYTSQEFQVMKNSIERIRDIGVNGFVFGILKKDNTLDLERNKSLKNLSGSSEVTFHRAFDQIAHPFTSTYNLIGLGFKRILTSGQMNFAIEATEFLADLIDLADNQISIMPGSGITSVNISKLNRVLNAKEYHTSAKILDSNGNYLGVDPQEVMKIKSLIG